MGDNVQRNGHILGHVQNLDVDGTKIDSVRIYKTTARQVKEFLFGHGLKAL